VAIALGAPGVARAAPVTLMGPGGEVRSAEEPALPAPPALHAAEPAAPRARAARERRPTVRGELRRLREEGRLDPARHDELRAAYDEARATLRRLEGARRAELTGVLAVVEEIAGAGRLTPERLEPLWRTLEANRRWWTTGPLLSPGQRVGFEGSELVWQHYPGSGVQLQALATFGKLNGFWRGGRRYDARLAALAEQVLPFAVPRAGGLAWESYFPYGRGRPGWVSAMTQATAAQALARAAARLGRGDDLLPVARAALGPFTADPPVGVRVPSGAGEHFLLYSFDPKLRVLNGFVQTLVGLYDLAQVSGEPLAYELFARGERAARAEVPAHDTGAWSLYSRGRVQRESDLGYHRLVGGFLGELCARTRSEPYCGAQARFAGYEREPPRLALRTTRLRGGRAGELVLELSKLSRVSVRVTRGSRVALARGPVALPFGRPAVAWKPPREPGRYLVALRAVDLAGNVATATASVRVTRPPGRRPR